MREVLAKLVQVTDASDSWVRADVGVGCYLFNFMTEIAWTLLACIAADTNPGNYCKEQATNASFRLDARNSAAAAETPKHLSGLPQAAREKLTNMLHDWMPLHCDKKAQTYKYTKVSYWLAVLRYVRDVGTHRSLCLVQPAEPIASNSAATLTPSALNVRVPINPAAASYRNALEGSGLPAFTTYVSQHVKVVQNGFCVITAGQLAKAMCEVAHIVHDGFAEVLNMCLQTTPSP